jgi:hypothetical protein
MMKFPTQLRLAVSFTKAMVCKGVHAMNICGARRLSSLAFVWFFLASVCEASNPELTFGQIQARLLNKQVVLRKKQNEWYVAERAPDGRFEVHRLQPVQIAENNQKGTIISITPVEDLSFAGKKDAFGKEVDISTVKNPYIQVIIDAPDGTLLGRNGYYTTMAGYSFEDPDQLAKRNEQFERQLSKLKGTTIYSPAYQELYEGTISLDELADRNARLRYLDRSTPPATPLKVIDAKISSEIDAPIIKVALPDGSTKILLGNFDSYHRQRGYKPSELDLMGFEAETSLKKFKPAEVKAIREQQLFRGMSVEALY